MKKMFVIPYDYTPSMEQLKAEKIRIINVHNDLKKYVRPVMTIEYADLNHRIRLKGNVKIPHITKETETIKGSKPILTKLKELTYVRV